MAILEPEKSLLFDPDFLRYLGIFYGAWASVDQVVDYAIGEFLDVTHEQAHLITAGLMFGNKAKLLAGLIARSSHEKKSVLLQEINVIRGQAKRDILAHAYLSATTTEVIFLDRKSGGEYNPVEHRFTKPQFKDHVSKVTGAARRFEEALGYDREKAQTFAKAALNAKNKPKESA